MMWLARRAWIEAHYAAQCAGYWIEEFRQRWLASRLLAVTTVLEHTYRPRGACIGGTAR